MTGETGGRFPPFASNRKNVLDYEMAGIHPSVMEQAATIVYDTHAAVRQLTESGMPEQQAEVVVQQQVGLLKHDLATRGQTESVRGEVEKLRQETKTEIAAVRGEVEKLRLETKAEIAAVRGEVEMLRQETKAATESVRAEVEKLRLETKAAIESVRSEIENLRLETKADIEAAKNSTIKWVVGMNLLMFGGIVALVGLI